MTQSGQGRRAEKAKHFGKRGRRSCNIVAPVRTQARKATVRENRRRKGRVVLGENIQEDQQLLLATAYKRRTLMSETRNPTQLKWITFGEKGEGKD